MYAQVGIKHTSSFENSKIVLDILVSLGNPELESKKRKQKANKAHKCNVKEGKDIIIRPARFFLFLNAYVHVHVRVYVYLFYFA